jgi:hypothetical protein
MKNLMCTKHQTFPRFQKHNTPLLTKNMAVSGILSFRATHRTTRRGSEQASALQRTVQQKPGQQMLNKPFKKSKNSNDIFISVAHVTEKKFTVLCTSNDNETDNGQKIFRCFQGMQNC